MALDFAFDPLTKDLIDAGDGSFVMTSTASTAMLHQLEQHYQAWALDPDSGSRLHDLSLFASDPAPLIADETERCLGVLVDAGRIADLQVIAEEGINGRVDVATRSRDVQTGQPIDLLITPSGA